MKLSRFRGALALLVLTACSSSGTEGTKLGASDHDAAAGGETSAGGASTSGSGGSAAGAGGASSGGTAGKGGSSGAPSGGASSGGTSPGGAAGTGGAPGATSCDPRKVLCKRVAPQCGTMEVPSVDGSCYGPCVPIGQCSCTVAEECPDSGQYTCNRSSAHCTPYLL